VLIFERIREELNLGKGIRLALKDGYLKAFSAIIDGNLTTLLVGIILYVFGKGPIQGFATILIIGILSSLFTAILISRVIFESQMKKEKILKFSTKYTEHAFKNVKIDFVGVRKIAYIASSIVIVAGIISMGLQGFKYGVDFSGGYSYVIRFQENVKANEITKILTKPLYGKPEVKLFGPKNQVKITTSYLINSNEKGASDSVVTIILNSVAKQYPNNKAEVLSTTKVGPTIADDIKKSAVWAVIFSLIGIFLYIFVRFRTWQYALAATLTPFHDVMVILGIFSIFQNIMPFSLEIDQAFIAALLTIVGYSINDTVVVFDRIREKLGLVKNRPFFEVINNALNETLSRTLLTAGTTVIVVIVLFIFGGEMIRGFSFAIMIGILVGTYSSIFVSTPILIEFSKKEQDKLRESQELKKSQYSK
jgi:SecD/SecF fusion protein